MVFTMCVEKFSLSLALAVWLRDAGSRSECPLSHCSAWCSQAAAAAAAPAAAFCSGLSPERWLPLAVLDMELQGVFCCCCILIFRKPASGTPRYSSLLTGVGARLTDILPQRRLRKSYEARCRADFPGILTPGRPSLGLQKDKENRFMH